MTTNMTTKTPRELLEAALAVVPEPFKTTILNLDKWSVYREATCPENMRALLTAHDAEIAALKAAQPVEIFHAEWLEESSYRAGAKAGYNLGIDENVEGLASLLAAHYYPKPALAQPAPAAPYQVPNGWQLVPVEPNHQMLEYFDRVRFRPMGVSSESAAKSMYAAMLEAAPKAAA